MEKPLGTLAFKPLEIYERQLKSVFQLPIKMSKNCPKMSMRERNVQKLSHNSFNIISHKKRR